MPDSIQMQMITKHILMFHISISDLSISQVDSLFCSIHRVYEFLFWITPFFYIFFKIYYKTDKSFFFKRERRSFCLYAPNIKSIVRMVARFTGIGNRSTALLSLELGIS